MISITPQGNIYLCNVPLENDYKNQLTFTNKENQETYFNSKIITTFDNYTYIKKDSVIKVGVNIDDIIGCNYLFYRNVGFTNKIYYCFITNKEYINENVTALTIETDVFQTYQFDMEFDYSFVEREHVDDDTIGKHTLPEGLEIGDYISTDLQPQGLGNGEIFDYCYVVTASDIEGVFTGRTFSFRDFKIPTGLYYIGLTSFDAIQQIVHCFDKAGKGDAIVSVFVTMKYFFHSWTENTSFTINGETINISGEMSTALDSRTTFTYNISRPSYVGKHYQPKNNKLFCYPYSFLQVSNHSGQVINYKWENFNLYEGAEPRYRFNMEGTITPGGSFKAFPLNYNNILNNNDDTITLGKLPVGAYVNDIYTNWLTQNGVNIFGVTIPADKVIIGKSIENSINEVSSLYDYVKAGGDATSSISAGITNTISNVFDATQEIYRASLVPDNVQGNLNTGDINFETSLYGLEFRTMTIKNEYASIVDNYFQLFGYKVNEMKIPNINTRTKWNYIKTISCEINGDIPQEHLNILKGMFNKGITFWHDPDHFLDYSQTNSIVT